MSDKYRTVTLQCECEHIEHQIRLQFLHDDPPYGLVYVTSPMKIDNVWRRFKEAIKLVVWGEIDSGLDILLGIEAMRKLSHFVGFATTEMIVNELKEKDHDQGGETDSVHV